MPPHFARRVKEFLDQRFPNEWIGRGGPIKWPPRSPDLTPLDFYLCGFVKSKVYHNKPRSVSELKARIIEAIESISQPVLESVFSEFERRIRLTIFTSGRHVEIY